MPFSKRQGQDNTLRGFMNSYFKNRRMRAQMFIVTMVFLVGLIFTVHQSLFQYSFTDLSQSAQKNDFYLFKNTINAFNRTLQLSDSCNNAANNLQSLADFLNQQIFRGGYSLDIEDTLGTLDCNNVGTPNATLRLTIHLIGSDTDTKGVFYLSPIKCSDWTNYGECSQPQPKYCSYYGVIIDNCLVCGCPPIKPFCNPDGTCSTSGEDE